MESARKKEEKARELAEKKARMEAEKKAKKDREDEVLCVAGSCNKGKRAGVGGGGAELCVLFYTVLAV
jgi:membrane protein involved in colicin uptake